MKLSLNVILCFAAVALFFLGRWTGAKTVPDNKRVLDSLTKDIATRVKREAEYVKNSNAKDSIAEYWKGEAQKPQEQKVIIRTIYRNDTARNNRLNTSQLDSVFIARYGAN